jgi:geranylgeranyl transferase type-1 subunit beta
LEGEELVNRSLDRKFLLSAQYPMGGIAKEPDEYPDPFHSYLALAALALGDEAGVLEMKKLDPIWNVSVETRTWMTREMTRVKDVKRDQCRESAEL